MPEVDERELEKMVNPIVQEYFEHGDTKEVQVRHLLLHSDCRPRSLEQSFYCEHTVRMCKLYASSC